MLYACRLGYPSALALKHSQTDESCFIYFLVLLTPVFNLVVSTEGSVGVAVGWGGKGRHGCLRQTCCMQTRLACGCQQTSGIVCAVALLWTVQPCPASPGAACGQALLEHCQHANSITEASKSSIALPWLHVQVGCSGFPICRPLQPIVIASNACRVLCFSVEVEPAPVGTGSNITMATWRVSCLR